MQEETVLASLPIECLGLLNGKTYKRPSGEPDLVCPGSLVEELICCWKVLFPLKGERHLLFGYPPLFGYLFELYPRPLPLSLLFVYWWCWRGPCRKGVDLLSRFAVRKLADDVGDEEEGALTIEKASKDFLLAFDVSITWSWNSLPKRCWSSFDNSSAFSLSVAATWWPGRMAPRTFFLLS